MLGYSVKFETITVGGFPYQIRSLADLQQYADPFGEAENMGISSASWPLFGHLWPSARILAQTMHSFDIAGKRILEIGAGLALASLVVQRREGNMTVTDWHPLSHTFLKANALLNALPPMNYQAGNWAAENPALGEFDLIIGSDILYERQHPDQLAMFIDRHAAASAEIMIVDPDRGHRVGFCKAMAKLGYDFTSRTADRFVENGDAYKGRFLLFSQA